MDEREQQRKGQAGDSQVQGIGPGIGASDDLAHPQMDIDSASVQIPQLPFKSLVILWLRRTTFLKQFVGQHLKGRQA